SPHRLADSRVFCLPWKTLYQGVMDLEQEGKKRDFRVRSFVGREQERRALDGALARAIRFDAPQFVTVIGESGLGKTRLVQEWVKHVEEGGEFRVFLADGRKPADRQAP